MFKRKSTRQNIQNLVDAQRMTMSSVDDREDHEVVSLIPTDIDNKDSDEKCCLLTKDKTNFIKYFSLCVFEYKCYDVF